MQFLAAVLPFISMVVNDARVERTEGAISVDLAMSAPIEVADVKAMTGPQRLYVFLQGAESLQAKFPTAEGPIVAHARSKYTKLEIPTGTGGRCLEPVVVEKTRTGLRLRALCKDEGEVTAKAKGVVQAGGEEPASDAMQPLLPRTKEQEALLRSVLAGKAVSPESEAQGSAGVKEEVVPAKATFETVAAKGGKEAKDPEPKPTLAKALTVQPGSEKPLGKEAVKTPLQSEDISKKTQGPLGGVQTTPWSLLSVALVLALLGGMAYFFARRRSTAGRFIRIVETASIGPKRSLVVATIGGRTLVLGVSEAGVALLDSQQESTQGVKQLGPLASVDIADPATPVGKRITELRARVWSMLGGGNQVRRTEAPESELEKSDLPQAPVRDERGFLAKLFPGESETAQAADQEFYSMLEDSFEDQELRRKLSMGVGGKVA